MNKLTAEKCRNAISRLEWEESGLTDEESLYLQAMEIALPILEQQERGEGWIEWGGGDCPVDKPTLVDLKYRDGRVFEGELAGNYVWTHGYYHYLAETHADIIAYRIIPERATNQNGEQ